MVRYPIVCHTSMDPDAVAYKQLCRNQGPVYPAERQIMGEANNVLQVYMQKPDRIQSVLEYFLGGKLPGDWRICEADGFYTIRKPGGRVSFRQRDIHRRIQAGHFSFQLGLENQDAINLIYPFRVMEMDCLAYEAGITKIQEHNCAQKVKYGKKDDFKYRYRQGDRLEPVLNLTLYWGREAWEKPRSLGDMVDRQKLPGKLADLFQDYKVHLVPMRLIPEEELQKMESDLKYVLGIMKCAGSRERYQKYIEENRDFFTRIPRSAADVISVYANMKEIVKYLEFQPGAGDEEETDMCKALRDMKRDAKKEGKIEGRAEEIIASGYEFGLSDENILDRLQKRMQISMQVAWQYLLRYGKHSESIGEKASV